jgi:hypothetical protein
VPSGLRFIYLNHGRMYAGVMTNNAVLHGIAVLAYVPAGAMPMLVACRAKSVTMLQGYLT